MKRKIIEINKALCNGCGQCITACAEGAIQLINGKAQLVSDSYCDGLGTCIGHCPQGAIQIIEKDTMPFEEKTKQHVHCHCAGSAPKHLQKAAIRNWPIQISLIPEIADYFENADLLIAADCIAFTYLNFHRDGLHHKTLLIGCPKLDNASLYTEKLSTLFKKNSIKNITVMRMEVSCCKSLTDIVKAALLLSKKNIPVDEVIISINGNRIK